MDCRVDLIVFAMPPNCGTLTSRTIAQPPGIDQVVDRLVHCALVLEVGQPGLVRGTLQIPLVDLPEPSLANVAGKGCRVPLDLGKSCIAIDPFGHWLGVVIHPGCSGNQRVRRNLAWLLSAANRPGRQFRDECKAQHRAVHLADEGLEQAPGIVIDRSVVLFPLLENIRRWCRQGQCQGNVAPFGVHGPAKVLQTPVDAFQRFHVCRAVRPGKGHLVGPRPKKPRD